MAIEDKVNEILGIEQPKASKEEFKAPVPRKEEKEKTDIDNDHKYSRENYYNLIKAFKDKTGVPIVFNTSFNLAGEPLVETLTDAVRALKESELEYCYFPEIKKMIVIPNAMDS